jgi:hypothetical protein
MWLIMISRGTTFKDAALSWTAGACTTTRIALRTNTRDLYLRLASSRGAIAVQIGESISDVKVEVIEVGDGYGDM